MDRSGCPRALTLRETASLYLSDLRTRARPSSVSAAESALARLARELPAHLPVRADGAELDASDLTVRGVMAWREARVAAGATNKTANTDVGYLRAALRLAVRMGELERDPLACMKGLPTGRRHQSRAPRALTDFEANRLVCAAEDSDAREPDKFPRAPLLATLAMTGARWGELAAVKWRGFDALAATLEFPASITKNGKARTIPLHPAVVEILISLAAPTRRLTGAPPDPDAPIFLARRGGSIATAKSSFHAWFHDMLRVSAIPHRDAYGRVVCVHALRHTFATRCARNGMRQPHTQALLGHSTARMTAEVYTQLRAEEARDALNGLPSLGVRGSVETSSAGALDGAHARHGPSQRANQADL